MVAGLALMILAGIFLVNGVPHFVQGITGQMHQTPFANPSSAVVNVLWGSANFILGAIFLKAGLAKEQSPVVLRILIAAAAGIATAVSLAYYWS